MILVYTEKITPRVEYIFKQILCKVLGFEITVTDNLEKAQQTTLPLINYSNTFMENSIQVTPAGLLTKTGIDRHLKPEVLAGKKRKIMFCTNRETLDFDLFAASFYLITRYEEYGNQEVDQHGRFKAKNSIAFRNQFLLEPLADQWACDFKEEILAKFPNTPCKTPEFRFIPTIDIDNSFAFRHKGIVINTVGLLRDLFKGRFDLVSMRLKAVLRLEKDPFFQFHFMNEVHDHYNVYPYYFILRGGYGQYDRKTIYPSYKEFKQLKKVARMDIVGIHPSYKASFNRKMIKEEIDRLTKIVSKKISISRFHYIRFRLPESYRMLEKLKINKDFSMGYSTELGFRASTSFPFHFYDLEKEKENALEIYPFQLMDRTAKDVLKLRRRDLIALAKEMGDSIAAVNGVYITIFHNEAFSRLPEWEKYRSTYRSILEHGAGLQKKVLEA
jgi:hypothetical protein